MIDNIDYGSIIRNNLMKQAGYTPYCGSNIPRPPVGNGCSNPRMVFDGQQFVCPQCKYRTDFPADFITSYKLRWNIVDKNVDNIQK